MTDTQKNKTINIVSLIILLLGNLLFFLTIWLLRKYDRIYIDQVIYQLKTSAAGAAGDIMSSAYIHVGLFGTVTTAIEVFLYNFFSGKLKDKIKSPKYQKYCLKSICKSIRQSALKLASIMLIFSILLFTFELKVVSYIGLSTSESDFIKKNYVSPNDVTLTFPKQKRNLVYIFLESMENTFADTKAGGMIVDNFIPEISNLAKQNTNFGGALSYTGTTWTAAAMVAQTSGIVVKVPLSAENYGGEDAYIPGVITLGEILQKEGYNQTLLLGSDAAFAGRDTYFTEHGNYKIVDINSLKEDGRLPKDYREWWGYEDSKLFEFAKQELANLAKDSKPFNFTMLTADTHFPNGYLCEKCENKYEQQYANVLACSSKQVYDFVNWIKNQPFYDNTTIIISGDHLTMDPDFLEDIDNTYIRTVYGCIINSPKTNTHGLARKYGAFDMFPTTLSALGVDIEGSRLGLGVDLYSSEKTLSEKYGYEALDEELQKKSLFYNTQFLKMEEKTVQN